MARVVLLDSGPLGLLTHPRAEQNQEAKEWLTTLVAAGVDVVLPEIVDYELRRKMLHIESTVGIRHLDELRENITYAPLTTRIMLRAARFWADARKQGLPTAPEERLDIDVILDAQAHSRLRAADALQLAAALRWCGGEPVGSSFVCLDERLRGTARKEGFRLLPA